MRKNFNFSWKIILFHKFYKSTKIISEYAYFTPKLFEMHLKGCCGLVCVFRWRKKTNSESFSVGQNLVIFQKKTHKTPNFRYFFFWPHPFFGRKQTNYHKNHIGHAKWPKCWPKKNFMTFWSELVAEIKNVRPPL